ncbi:DUF1810 family protein [Legionella rowbothamii]|uniref:DUF1810 family protein n=1 Tax=Legionella rowbothamii TaxID=96229 RepID=UPI001055C167|nr:DUF1810 family protein [Legionella rowbothamii]
MSIERFIQAQQGQDFFPTYLEAYKEIAQGRKTSHWIWYIFPQLQSLGHSSTAKHYGIVDLHEACNYLQNTILFEHYNEIIHLVLKQLQTIPLRTLMGGSIDTYKLVSSVTLFRKAAFLLSEEGETGQDYNELIRCCDLVLRKTADQGYPPCQHTLEFT